MADLPADPLHIIDRFGPHVSAMTGVRLSTSVEPDRLVKTHCCFCGQQCGIQLKVRDNHVIGFEPWEDFPFNRGMLCPKGVKRYLQGSHPEQAAMAILIPVACSALLLSLILLALTNSIPSENNPPTRAVSLISMSCQYIQTHH